MRNAIGTSLVIIALNSIAAVIGYIGQVNFDWQLILHPPASSSVGDRLDSIDNSWLERGFNKFSQLPSSSSASGWIIEV